MRVATNRAGILLAIMHPGYQDTTTYAALALSNVYEQHFTNEAPHEGRLHKVK